MVLLFFLITSAAAATLLLLGMKKLISVSEKRRKQSTLWIGCWLLLNMIIYIGDWGNILPTIFAFLFLIWITCEGSIWKKTAIGMMYASTVLAYNVLRDNFLLTVDIRHYFPVIARIFSPLFSLLLTLFLYVAIRKFAPAKEYHLADSLWKLLLLLTATPFGIVLSLVLLTNNETSLNKTTGSFRFTCFILLLLALISFAGLFWTVLVLARQQQLEEQSMLAEMNRSYYESMEQQHFAIRRLKHDLANHLAVAATLPEEQREEYITSLIAYSPLGHSLQYCADTVVNAVLTVKEDQMSRFCIRLETQIDIPVELPFEKADICALFSNALDNASEACRQLPEDKRRVHLKCKAQKGLFCLEVTNPVSRNEADPHTGPIPDDSMVQIWEKGDLPSTSKPDQQNHGLGLKSIKEIVERGRGALELKADGSVFELFLYMPLDS